MKYKVLICGKSKAVIDDFFIHLDTKFDAQTTSLRYGDVYSHLRNFYPDVVLLCMHDESQETISTLVVVKDKFEQYGIPLVIIGNEEECEKFQKDTYKMAQLVLTKPILIRNIGEKIEKFIATWKAEHETEIPKEIIMPTKEQGITLNAMPQLAETKEMIPDKKHVLVVDDDPMMLKMIKEHLKDTYTVATAISGSIALNFLENKKTNLIILDYEMPGENGADILKKIRENEATSNLPVVFLTGITEREKIHKVLRFKPQGYLLKPIEREKLLKTIADNI